MLRIRTRRPYSLVPVLVLLLGACEGETTSPEQRVADVEVTPPQPSVTIGAQLQLQARAVDETGSEVERVEVVWSSSDTTRLRVDASGRVTGVLVGTATVTARAADVERQVAVAVTPEPGLAAGATVSWKGISAGSTHSCGLTTVGKAYCWGENAKGQLGDGTTTSSGVPRPVAGGLAFASVAVSVDYTCGLTPAGDTYCWGSGWGMESLVPVKHNTQERFTQLAGGRGQACALNAAGTAFCWGTGARVSYTTPTTPSGPAASASFAAVTAGTDVGCGLQTGGNIICWVGAGFASNVVGTVSGAQSIDASLTTQGYGFVCALAPGSVPSCTTLWSPSPGGQVFLGGLQALPAGPAVRTVSAGGERACGLDAGGAVYCWPRRVDSTASFKYRFDPPAAEAQGFSFAQLSVGDRHSCAITSGGEAYCWGSNASGQLGTGAPGGERTTPVRVGA